MAAENMVNLNMDSVVNANSRLFQNFVANVPHLAQNILASLVDGMATKQVTSDEETVEGECNS